MYVPKEFSVKDQTQRDAFIAEHPFVTLTSVDTDGFPIATHLPVIAKQDEQSWIFEGHMALANNQSQHVQNGQKALVIITGSDAYISSSLYTHENAPTWNYEAVHAYGVLELLTNEELDKHLDDLVAFFEKNRVKPLVYSHFSPTMIESYKKEIVGFRLKAVKIEAAFKLSQNRNEIDQKAIIADLEKCPFSGAQEMAKVMKSQLKRNS